MLFVENILVFYIQFLDNSESEIYSRVLKKATMVLADLNLSQLFNYYILNK